MQASNTLKHLTLFAFFLAFVVVGLGAYTRLKDAGLGCPDWPGCYGHLIMPSSDSAGTTASAEFNFATIDPMKARWEMIHRYVASTLGLLIFVIAFLTWRDRQAKRLGSHVIALIGLVIFQGLLGMWTVTLKLLPIVVMAHLVGGFTTLSLLFLYWLRLRGSPFPRPSPRTFYRFATLALVVLAAQIMLGAWTSTNYAAMSCPDLPTCQGQWLPTLDIASAFDPLPEAEDTYEFGVLDNDARVTIQFFHRVGALITLLTFLSLAVIGAFRAPTKSLKRLSIAVGFVACLQFTLGIGNILTRLNLHVALTHNLVAALLLLLTLAINYRIRSRGAS